MTGNASTPPEQAGLLRIEKAVYGGDGRARTAAGEVASVPFALPGELVAISSSEEAGTLRILEPSPDRVEPRCVHFGVCGGCQYQMADYPAQLAMKGSILRDTLESAGVDPRTPLQVWPSPQPWQYRNRIRLRVRTVWGVLRLGYSRRGTQEFLPIRMCPLAAPILWSAAEALMEIAAERAGAAAWLGAATEVEIGCDEDGTRVGVHLLCAGEVPPGKAGFAAFAEALQATGLSLASMSASRLHVASGRPMQTLAAWGADGMTYRVGAERFWLERGSFFQVNRFLLPTMLEVIVRDRRGRLAWDLYAGVGLFARALTGGFAQVTAVETNPVALRELRRGLTRPGDGAIEDTTIAFLRGAAVQRDRPDLVVLDPPRAGAGAEASGLLARLRPPEIVYVSCDPTTLARDAAILLTAGYRVAEWHMVDLFPQTYHLETVMVFRSGDVAG